MTLMQGKPRGLQRDRVIARFRSAAEGDPIPHSEIESLIGERRGSRYYGIVKTAIREYRDESGVEFQNVPTVGYVRPTGADQLRAGVVRTGRAGKMLRHGVKTIAGVSNERLDGKHQEMRDHLVGRMRYLAELVKTERRPMLTMVVGTPEVTPPRGRSS